MDFDVSGILKDAEWYVRNRALIGRVLANPDVRALIDAFKELGDGGSAAVEPGAFHKELVRAGVNTEQLAKAIHPVGPPSEGPALGANI